MNNRTERVFLCIGELEDKWLEEAETTVFVPVRFGKVAKVSVLAAAASIGVAAALLIYRASRTRAKVAAV